MDHPVEAFRGRSAQEILAYGTQMAQTIGTGTYVPSVPNPGTNVPTPGTPSLPTNETWTERPNEAARAIADAALAQAMGTVTQNFQSFAQTQASTIRALASQQYQDDFKRWGPEIDGHMSRLPLEQRTLDNYGKLVKFVRGEHMDELVREKAQAMVAQGGLGERSTGANGLSVPAHGGIDFNKVPAGFGELVRKHGLTEAQVTEFCQRTGMTTDQWIANANGNQLFTSESPFQTTMTEAKLGITKRFD